MDKQFRTHPDFTGFKFYWDETVTGRTGARIMQKNTKTRIYRDDHTRTFVSRAAYEAWYGPIPEGLLVLHHDEWAPVPYLNAPWNLNLGTQSTNLQDCSNKGRICRVGGRRKLTDEDVDAIRALDFVNTAPECRKVGEKYGVSWRTIFRIREGHTYRFRR